jgi:hypothetical protein
MKSSFKHVLPLLLLIPYICAYVPNPDGDEEYSAAIAAGHGSYADVHRDCNGNVLSIQNYEYTDVGGQFNGRIDAFAYGIGGGWTNGLQPISTPGFPQNSAQTLQPIVYASPYVGVATKYFRADVGILFSVNGNLISIDKGNGQPAYPTGALRIGRDDGFHFSSGFLRNDPIVSGGGVFDLGFGGPVGKGTDSKIWLGLGALPYDGIVFSMKGDFALSEDIAITPAIHGKGGDAAEYGFSVGARVTF